MKSRIVIESPYIENNKITYNYEVDGEWKDAFTSKRTMEIEYSVDISTVPLGIAILPFLANILPMAWIYDAEVIIPVCDKAFYDSIPEFKRGYKEMYPMMSLEGKLTVSKLEENTATRNGKSGAFFSGGVDAFNTLVCHENEKPTLMTLWGADVKLDDEKGWLNVLAHIQETSTKFGVNYVTIKSGFRTFLNEGFLTKKVEKSGDGWWHGFQHGIGLICHAAPVAWVLKLETIYIASSYTVADKGRITCASDPTIDNFVRFAGTHIVHDGYEFTRQMKVHNITQFAVKNNVKIPLRVCWESTGGSNCCHCEKCLRTMLEIYAENQDPHDYGFNYDDKDLEDLSQMVKHIGIARHLVGYYFESQQAMKKNIKKTDLTETIQWFYDVDIHTLGKVSLWKKYSYKLQKKLKNIFGGTR